MGPRAGNARGCAAGSPSGPRPCRVGRPSWATAAPRALEDVRFRGCEELLTAILRLAVNGGARDAEQFRNLGLRVLASIVHLEQQGPSNAAPAASEMVGSGAV